MLNLIELVVVFSPLGDIYAQRTARAGSAARYGATQQHTEGNSSVVYVNHLLLVHYRRVYVEWDVSLALFKVSWILKVICRFASSASNN